MADSARVLPVGSRIHLQPQRNDGRHLFTHLRFELRFNAGDGALKGLEPCQARWREFDQFRSRVTRITLSGHQVPGLTLVDQVTHGLLAHACTLRQRRQTRSFDRQMPRQVNVGRTDLPLAGQIGQGQRHPHVVGHEVKHPFIKAAHGLTQEPAEVVLSPIDTGDQGRSEVVIEHPYMVRQTDQIFYLQVETLRINYCSSIQFQQDVFLILYFNLLINKELIMDAPVKSLAALSEKTKALQAALAQIEKQFGKGTIMRLGEGEVIEDIQVVSTGSLGLDIALGVGGLPRGRVIEIYGPESSGKTTLTLQVIAEMQKQNGTCAFVDAEHALDIQYAQKLGVNLQELLISQPDTGEQALEIVDSLVRSGAVDLIVIDSVAALTPKAELEGDMGDSLPGLQARLMSQALRKLTATIKKTNCMVIFINQIRMKIGVMFGSPETTTGGNALKFYASVRIDIRRTGTIKRGEEAIGNETKVKVVKNKVAPPFKTAEFDILFGEGISRHGEVIDLGVTARVIDKSGAWYAYNGEKIGQGRDNSREFLRENPELAHEIENKVRESLGIPSLPQALNAPAPTPPVVAAPAGKTPALKTPVAPLAEVEE